MYIDNRPDPDTEKFRGFRQLKPTEIWNKSQECLAEKCANDKRKREGLPQDDPVVIHICCPCPKCRPQGLGE